MVDSHAKKDEVISMTNLITLTKLFIERRDMKLWYFESFDLLNSEYQLIIRAGRSGKSRVIQIGNNDFTLFTTSYKADFGGTLQDREIDDEHYMIRVHHEDDWRDATADNIMDIVEFLLSCKIIDDEKKIKEKYFLN